MMRCSIAGVFACALALAVGARGQTALPVVRPGDVGMSAARLELIDQAMEVNIASGQIPGAIVLVARDGKVVFVKAKGAVDPHGRRALRTDTLFNLASLSKPITAVAVLMLVDEGKVGLDDPIGKYIPQLGGQRMVRVLKPGSPPLPYSPLPGVLPETAEFGAAQTQLVPAARAITVRDLLTHTSGIQIFGVDNAFPKPVAGDTLATRLPKLAQAPLEFQPGSRWAYSNGWGFDVLGRVVEVASGMNFRQFLKQRLWGPLGMTDTDFGVSQGNVGRALPRPDGSVQRAEDTTYFSGAAGMVSSVPDYAKFVVMLVDGGRANGHQFLRPQTLRAMTSNQIGWLAMGGYPPMALPPEGVRFGYGVVEISNPDAAGTHLPKGSFGWDGVGTRRWWAVPDAHVAIVSMVPLIGPAAAPLQRVVEAIVMGAAEAGR